jgi:Ca2+/Na+ antiporter
LDEIYNILNNNFSSICISIAKANLIAIGIVILSYIIEKLTGLRLFIDHYTWIKSENNAETLSIGDTVYYFILNLIVFIYDIYMGKIEFHVIAIVTWLLFVGILAQIFYLIHGKYQKVDPNKSDNDYT